jgi:hypothetical protein
MIDGSSGMAEPTQTGDQNLAVHQESYHHFMLTVKWFVLHVAALVVFLTTWFATSAGFWLALLAGIAVWAVGVYAMTHGLGHSSERHWPPAPLI